MGKINEEVQTAQGAVSTQRKPGRPKGTSNEVSHVRKGGVEARRQAMKAIASIANNSIKIQQRMLDYLK